MAEGYDTVGTVEEYARGWGFLEGPVVCREQILAVSMDRGEVLAFSEKGTSVLFQTGGGPNGLAVGSDGSLYIAQNGAKPRLPGQTPGVGGVQMASIEPNAPVRWLSQYPTAPNDLCFGPDGELYVTDPVRPGNLFSESRLWRINANSGTTELLAVTDWFANGIAFDESDHLLVASTQAHQIVRFEWDDGDIRSPEVFADTRWALPDGLAVDDSGNVLVAAVSAVDRPGGIMAFNPSGEMIEELIIGESHRYTNLALDASGLIYVTDADLGTVVKYHGWPHGVLPLYPERSRGGSGVQ